VGSRPITGATRIAAVIGSPIGRSLSPAIHNAAFAAAGLDWRFVAFDVPSGDVARALDGMRALGLAGLSVTTPHKDDVAALVDERSADAEALGAVNCVVPVGHGLLRGENTDGPGFVAALRDAGVDPAGMRCRVLGAGGAARAVVLALGRAGASEVGVLNRTVSKAERAAALAGGAGFVATRWDDGELVVNATSIGMGGGSELPLDPGQLRRGHVVAELVVQPVRTALLDAAAASGCLPIDGVGMLVHQAAAAFEAWTGQSAPVTAMMEAARGALDDREDRVSR
jgi:shikimate dehydrogenase